MSATYFMRAAGITNAVSKVYFSLYNAAGSTVVVRVYRIWFVLNHTAALTGGTGIYTLDRFTGVPGGGNAITILKHNTASAAVSASVTALGGNSAITGTLNSNGVIKQIWRSNDEAQISSYSIDELQTIYPLNLIWDSGYGDTNVEPLVLRAGQGLRMVSGAAGTWVATTTDIVAEFTIL